MKDALDIYIKLLVAIISFIAPLLINLLSIFSDGIAIKKKRLEEYESQTTALVKDGVDKGLNIAQLITQEASLFKTKKDKTTKQLNLLDPKRQIFRIFPTFFYSLVLIILNRLFCDDDIINLLSAADWPLNLIKWVLFLGSIGFAIWGVEILRNVIMAIIEVKQEIANDVAKEKQQSISEKVTQLKGTRDNSTIENQ